MHVGIFMPIPWGKDNDHLSLFLEVGNYESLPIGWRRHAKYSFTISNQSSGKLSRKHGKYLDKNKTIVR